MKEIEPVVIQVGPTISRIYGDIPDYEYSQLRTALTYEDKSATYKAAAMKAKGKKGAAWIPDRICLMTPARKQFQTGLLSRVQENLKILDIPFTIKDDRTERSIDHFFPLKAESSMREYQQDAIQAAIDHKCGMIRMATGGGKTRVMAGIVAVLERKAVILVHRLDLMHQVLSVLSDLLMYPDLIGRVGGGVYEPNLISVCTVQTITAALGIKVSEDLDDDGEKVTGAAAHAAEIKAMLDQASVIILDEAHHAPAKTISEVMQRAKGATWRIGLSATDWRDDGADLLIEAAFGPRIIDISLSDLCDLGYLVPANVRMVRQALPDIPDFSGGWQAKYRHFYTENEPFHHQVLEVNKAWHSAGRHILTLVTQIKHGAWLERLHNEAGIRTVFLSGKDPTEERKRIMNLVRSGELRHLIGTSIADEGLDMPILDAINLAGGGKSTTKAYQRIGRTLRPFRGKVRSEVMDYRCVGDDGLFKHSGRRAGVYRRERCFTFKEEK